MKIYFYFLFIFCLVSLNSNLNAQKVEAERIVSIKGYKNANNKKVAKNPIKAELILDLPTITLYRVFSASSVNVNQGGGNRGNVDVSDTFWYCKRPGEEVATIVSWTFNTQVNKNNIFRKNAAEYFKDYPELSKKIEDKEYKHEDILDVVQEYDKWKLGK